MLWLSDSCRVLCWVVLCCGLPHSQEHVEDEKELFQLVRKGPAGSAQLLATALHDVNKLNEMHRLFQFLHWYDARPLRGL